mmetsp:Transcript_26514/g.23491  ORF Transcript_26514/g.23491 Transcript_26514/m.23491 type:complete len:107 (+) Transcript_26514:142-462(+)
MKHKGYSKRWYEMSQFKDRLEEYEVDEVLRRVADVHKHLDSSPKEKCHTTIRWIICLGILASMAVGISFAATWDPDAGAGRYVGGMIMIMLSPIVGMIICCFFRGV